MIQLDLTGTRIQGELSLASLGRMPNWASNAVLKLRNAQADVLQNIPTAWPANVELDGFVWSRFGSYHADTQTAITSRDTARFKEWLAKDKSCTSQPYQQCAKVLREMGHPEMADDVLYAGRERERKGAPGRGNNPRWTWLTVLKLFIGYGYGTGLLRYPLAWVLGLTVFGAVVLQFSGIPTGPDGSAVDPWFFSLDLLLPIIQLYWPHYEIMLDGCAKYYFAFHQVMGYVLAFFLIAGLLGLTK